MKLSNSAINTYQTCGMRYKLHYINKLRPTTVMSSLHFGKALDSALNHILLSKKENRSSAEDELLESLTPFDIFSKEFATADINGKFFNVEESPGKILWTKGDWDVELLEEGDFEKLATLSDFEITRSNIYSLESDVFEMIKESKKVYGELLIPFNLICYLSLRRKAALLLEAFKTDIMPQIDVVHEIQPAITLPNGSGDEIVGFVDFVATFKDGIKRIIDNKTSSRSYNEKDLESQQLAIYSEALGIRDVGYAVLHKNLRKKAPFVKTQLLFTKISEELLEKVFDTVGETEYNIKKEKFEKNFDGCFSFGQKCPYFAYCRGESLDNLECLKKED